jgi:hypothetical protein
MGAHIICEPSRHARLVGKPEGIRHKLALMRAREVNSGVILRARYPPAHHLRNDIKLRK